MNPEMSVKRFFSSKHHQGRVQKKNKLGRITSSPTFPSPSLPWKSSMVAANRPSNQCPTPTFPKNTTKTAQYLPSKTPHQQHVRNPSPNHQPTNSKKEQTNERTKQTHPALAATISCLLALVNADIAALKTSVNTNTTPIVSELVAMTPSTEKR